ncbi:peptide chain release factor 1 [Candidatus Viridilinea mediisalina]|uniref:Peptide chain release factor 1 n=1 Tax=Candidatus Viridilinea mediisalina TaxID=2024553 RepID=A0A2A6RG87_9CHLR|nr:peptide chain release factor 1 [Candidatus Viridilinea mediisalina]PDW01870.1 peptide chain release factor 1 [Candidatus Viridilinea mediisalina]
MFDKLTSVVARYEELGELLASSEVVGNLALLQQYAREQRELEAIVAAYRSYLQAQAALDEAQTLLLESDDAELRALAQEEIETQRAQLERLDGEIRLLLLPRDPNDEKHVIIEIRQGEGGDEAALFAADLYRMYTRYAEERGWRVEIDSSTENGPGGLKEIIFEIRGEGAYSVLKYEGGVHRVQRVPATEARGRIHTSTATVAVLPEVEPTAVEIKHEDLRVDVFRAGGHGGQGVNTTDSAVRVVYRAGTPEEIVVTCQDGRSQLKNKDKAMSVLRAKLYAREQEKQDRALSSSRLAQVGTGERAEKIRTYNFPQDRVTDHRLGQNFSNLPGLLDGNLQKLIDALIVHDNAERLRASGIG